MRLPRRLSLWADAHGAGGEAFGDEEEEEVQGGERAGVPGGSRAGGGGAGLLVRLRRTALVIDL